MKKKDFFFGRGNPRLTSTPEAHTHLLYYTHTRFTPISKRGQIRSDQVTFEQFDVHVATSIDEEMKFKRVRIKFDGPPGLKQWEQRPVCLHLASEE